MFPGINEAEVEYNIRRYRESNSNIPVEFRDLLLEKHEKHPARQSKFLLYIAETFIKIGVAIKNTQINTSEQKIYS